MQMRQHIAVAAFAVVGLGVSPLAAQRRSAPPHPAGPAPRAAEAPRSASAGANPVRGNAAQQLERFQKMSPEEREKALKKLPPGRRARVEQQLENLDRLTPEQRERRFRRLEAFQNLPPQRRQIVRQEIEDLRALPPRLRRDRLYGSEMKGFSSDEQQLIRESFPGIRPPQLP
jgi:hypothetical protein